MECNIKCGACGHEANYEAFTTSKMGLELPNGTFQCPGCGTAWEMKKVGEARVFESGLVIPAKRTVCFVDPKL